MDGANQPISDLYYALGMAIEALEQTEPTISKMEQVGDEPQTPYDNCQSCLHWVYDGYWYCECNECHYEPKDEPRTDCAWR